MSEGSDNGQILYPGFGDLAMQSNPVVRVCRNVCVPIVRCFLSNYSAFSLSSELAEGKGALLPMVGRMASGGV